MLRFFRTYIEQKALKDYDQLLIDRIAKIKRESIFENPNSVCFAKYNELDGYKFLSLIITGFLEIDTYEHCILDLIAANRTLTVKSESPQVKGEYSEQSQIGITKFDLDITNELIEFVNNNTIKCVALNTRSGQLLKQDLQFEYRKINQPLMIELIGSLD